MKKTECKYCDGHGEINNSTIRDPQMDEPCPCCHGDALVPMDFEYEYDLFGNIQVPNRGSLSAQWDIL